jgi:hypothetical protein
LKPFWSKLKKNVYMQKIKHKYGCRLFPLPAYVDDSKYHYVALWIPLLALLHLFKLYGHNNNPQKSTNTIFYLLCKSIRISTCEPTYKSTCEPGRTLSCKSSGESNCKSQLLRSPTRVQLQSESLWRTDQPNESFLDSVLNYFRARNLFEKDRHRNRGAHPIQASWTLDLCHHSKSGPILIYINFKKNVKTWLHVQLFATNSVFTFMRALLKVHLCIFSTFVVS